MSVLKWNGYTFTPTPRVVVDEEPLGSDDGALQAMREVWTIKGELLGDQASLITQRDALEAALAANGGDLTLYRDDGVSVMRQLLNSGCANGTHIRKPPTYPQGDGAVFATFLPYELAITGVKTFADAPSATAWGQKTTSTAEDAQGQVHVIVQGAYTGAGAQAAADAAKLTLNVLVVKEEQSEPDAENKVAFRYEYISTASSREVVSFVETVTVRDGSSRKVFRYILGGSVPTRQTAPVVESAASQEGRAVGLTGYPTIPDPLYSAADYAADPEFSYQSPRRGPDGVLTEYEVRWRYQFAKSTPFSLEFPNTPPS